MKQYTTYCTEEQTCKAFEIGAPIDMVGNDGASGNERTVVIGEDVYIVPTAEQMQNWIIEKMGITTWHIDFFKYYETYGYWLIGNGVSISSGAFDSCKTREEAMMMAIDAALECLKERKNAA